MAPSCTLENGIKLEHPNPPSAIRWWLKQLIPALCRECRRVIRAEHFDDPAAPFLCNTCLKKTAMVRASGSLPLLRAGNRTGQQNSMQPWGFPHLASGPAPQCFCLPGDTPGLGSFLQVRKQAVSLIPARTAFRPGDDRAGNGERLFLHGPDSPSPKTAQVPGI